MSDTDFDTLFDDKARAAHAAGPVGYDEEGVRQAVRLFLKSIGEDPDREGLLDTPDRIGRACKELFAGLGHGPEEVLKTRFKVDTDEMVLVATSNCSPSASIICCRSMAWPMSATSRRTAKWRA